MGCGGSIYNRCYNQFWFKYNTKEYVLRLQTLYASLKSYGCEQDWIDKVVFFHNESIEHNIYMQSLSTIRNFQILFTFRAVNIFNQIVDQIKDKDKKLRTKISKTFNQIMDIKLTYHYTLNSDLRMIRQYSNGAEYFLDSPQPNTNYYIIQSLDDSKHDIPILTTCYQLKFYRPYYNSSCHPTCNVSASTECDDAHNAPPPKLYYDNKILFA
jgi:hypothetical protein